MATCIAHWYFVKERRDGNENDGGGRPHRRRCPEVPGQQGGRGLRVGLLQGPGQPPVKADPQALTQCVQNLLSNALKYGKTGDTAQIEIVAQKDAGSGNVRLLTGPINLNGSSGRSNGNARNREFANR